MPNGTAAQPASPIDYAALAAKYGAIESTPPVPSQPASPSPSQGQVDYNKLAAQYGAINSQPAPGQEPPTQDQPVTSRIWQGVKDSSLGRVVASAITPPASSDEQVVHAVGGTPALQVYRAAKSIVDSAKGMMKSASSDYSQAVQDFNRAVQDFHNQDWRNLASSATSTAADVAGMTQPEMAGQAQNVRELSEGARPGGNLATPLTRQAVDAGTAAATVAAAPALAEGSEAGDGAEGADSTSTPVSSALEKGALHKNS